MLTTMESKGHGKAVKGTKRTSTIQVIEPFGDGYLLKKQFRFTVGDIKSKRKAEKKALKWIEDNE